MKYSQPTFTAERLRELFSYDPETGFFTRLLTVAPNAKYGTVCRAKNTPGYVQICVHGRLYLAHRLAWMYMTGGWPAEEIDHIDRDKGNNAWRNLRAATRSQNMINRVRRRPNGLPRGVYASGDRFQAQIAENGKFRHLGMFATAEAAAAAFDAAARQRAPDFLPTVRL